MVNCKFFLDNDRNSVFFPGQTIKGHAVLVLDEPKSMRSLKILIHGEAYAYCDYSQNHRFLGTERYLNFESVVFGETDGPTVELPAGTFRYNFEYQLPEDIPASFEYKNFHKGSKAYIRYFVEMKMDMKWKLDKDFLVPFEVVRSEDLNLIPELALPCSEDEIKTFCCLFCASGPLQMEVCLPQTGYAEGETIPIKVKYLNKSNVNIERTDVVLKRYFQLFSTTEPSLIRRKQQFKSVVIAKCQGEGINPNSEDEVNINLKLPGMEPSCDIYCKVIKKFYELQVTASGPKWSRNSRVIIPITIGKIPINRSQIQHEMKN